MQCVTDQQFVGVRPVDVGGVDQGDPPFDAGPRTST
jgi:hypothetical protein